MQDINEPLRIQGGTETEDEKDWSSWVKVTGAQTKTVYLDMAKSGFSSYEDALEATTAVVDIAKETFGVTDDECIDIRGLNQEEVQ